MAAVERASAAALAGGGVAVEVAAVQFVFGREFCRAGMVVEAVALVFAFADTYD